jgi:Flp pilus assembly protein TadD
MTNQPRTDFHALLAAAAIMLAGLAAYGNSSSGPFVFDDIHSVVKNPTIRHLWPVWEALQPPRDGSTVEGRPVVNLSLAINYAATALNPGSYHVFNVLIHLLAGLALFGLVRRTLTASIPGSCPATDRPDPLLFAFAAALLWTVHPLQTESVTFVSDRAESLMGLFYLLTLYCFARAAEGASLTHSLWLCLSVFACLLGMATKEVMVSAPLMVFLYDRTFFSGTFRGAWRQRRTYYVCLGSTWVLLALLVVGMGGSRGKAAGFGTVLSSGSYALTQCKAVVHYLLLSLWPHPLVFDYGSELVSGPGEVGLQAIILLLLVAATFAALWSRPVLAFLGAWFFLILAPSSSIVPLASQAIAEHRMYLPLAAVIVLAVWAIWKVSGSRVIPYLMIICLVAGGLGVLTFRRNEVYRSQISLWQDTALKRPDSVRARYNLGVAFEEAGRRAEARDQFLVVVRLDPFNADAHFRLANDLAAEGRMVEAIAHFQEAAFLNPRSPDVHRNLGNALAATGRARDAAAQFAEADRLQGGTGAAVPKPGSQ